MKQLRLLLYVLLNLFSLICGSVTAVGEVIFAVNCGGESHTDVHGIRYQRDFLTNGISSDYGKNLVIQRVLPQDQILYQTERYHTSTFGYDVPIKTDGDYVLVLKFSEVWFTASGQKVFDVILNGEHTIVEALDIFSLVGRGTAHDEIIPFSIKSGMLKIGTETSKIESNKITVEFLKGDNDNPKINAIYVIKGSAEEIPRLPPIPGADEPVHEHERGDEDDAEDREQKLQKPDKKRKLSGPPVADPYATDDTSSMLLPVIVAVGAFIPLVFCLCKL